jgi:hypothetical protein
MIYLGAGISAAATFLIAFYLTPLAQEAVSMMIGSSDYKAAPFIGIWNAGLSLVAALFVFWAYVRRQRVLSARARSNLIARARS